MRAGTVHQVLVCAGDDCVGWCQYGRPAELPSIKNPDAYNKGLVDLPDWRIGCIFTGSRHRRGDGRWWLNPLPRNEFEPSAAPLGTSRSGPALYRA